MVITEHTATVVKRVAVQVPGLGKKACDLQRLGEHVRWRGVVSLGFGVPGAGHTVA